MGYKCLETLSINLKNLTKIYIKMNDFSEEEKEKAKNIFEKETAFVDIS